MSLIPDPPTTAVVGAATPATRVFYAWWLFAGVAAVVGALTGAAAPSSLSMAPQWVVLYLGGSLAIGGGLATTSTMRLRYVTTSWTMERVGLVLGLCAWTAYLLIAGVMNPYAVLTWGSALAQATFAAARIWMLSHARRATIATVRQMEES